MRHPQHRDRVARPSFVRSLAVCFGVLPWAIVVFTVLVTGLVSGAALLITLAGMPILAGTLHLARRAADLEGAIFRWAVDADIHRVAPTPAPSDGQRRWAVLRRRSAWHDLVLRLLRLPVGIASFAVTLVLVTTPVIYVTAPLTYGWVSIWGITGEIESRTQALLAIPQGLVLAAAAAVTIPAMARLLGRTASAGSASARSRFSGVRPDRS